MKSLRINFGDGEPQLDFGGIVEGADNEMQCVLVNLSTDKYRDPYLHDRGTSLFRTALNSSILDSQTAQFQGAVASAEVQRFVRNWTWADSPDMLDSVRVDVIGAGNQSIDYTVEIELADGRVVQKPSQFRP